MITCNHNTAIQYNICAMPDLHSKPYRTTPIKLVEIYNQTNGRTCEDHEVCDRNLREDNIVRIRDVIIKNIKFNITYIK